VIETKALFDIALYCKPPFFLYLLCNKLRYLPDGCYRCFITGSLLQSEVQQIEQIWKVSLIHTCLQKQSWYIVINCMLPQCPNSHGLWEG